MSATVVNRSTWTDDSGTGLTGTIINNAQLQIIYDNVDLLMAGSSPTTLEVGGGFKADQGILRSVVSKTANYTILSTDGLVICTSGSFTVTLPTAVGIAGRAFTVKNTGSGTITMASTSSQTIDTASAGSTLILQNDSYTFESDGANWVVN